MRAKSTQTAWVPNRRMGAVSEREPLVALRDPDVHENPDELDRVRVSGATHILVAVIAFAGPKSPLPAWRFVCNLAGGNLNAQGLSGDAIREQAKEIRDYWSDWSVVAD